MGCTRLPTSEDAEQIAASLAKGLAGERSLSASQKAVVRETLAGLGEKLAGRLRRGDPGITALALRAMASKLTDPAEVRRFADALAAVVSRDPNAIGLFRAASLRGPGASAVQHHYEIEAAAEIMRIPYYSKRFGFELKIESTDKLGYGVKLAAGYAQPKRHGTIEADQFISRGNRDIGIDMKHSEKKRYNNIEDRQLQGIRRGLRDGKIHEFYFVTNGKFGSKFLDAVERTNREIAQDRIRQDRRLCPDPSLLHSDEKDGFALGALPKDEGEYKKFVAKHGIPQIDLCEWVQFGGI